MSTEVARASANAKAEALESVLIQGDLSKLTTEQRVEYYRKVCHSLGLNPLTKPFEYLELDKKLVLYAKRDATDQLRKIHGITITITDRRTEGNVHIVTARAKTADGREDESTGAVCLEKENGEWATAQSGKRYFKGDGTFSPLRGESLANAFMKAETKSKRRVTLSICGLGLLDETEIPPPEMVVVQGEAPRPPQLSQSDRAVAHGERIDAAATMDELKAVMAEVNADAREKFLTPFQIDQLTKRKDIRKAALAPVVAPEGEERQSPTTTSATTTVASTPTATAAPAASPSPAANAPAPTEPVPATMPAAERRTAPPAPDTPMAGGNIVSALLELMGKAGASWTQVRDRHEGAGAAIAKDAGLPELPAGARVNQLAAADALRLHGVLETRVKKNKEVAAKAAETKARNAREAAAEAVS